MADEEIDPAEIEGEDLGEGEGELDDAELEEMKNKVKEMEDEAEKLRKIQEQVEGDLAEEGGEEGTAEADSRSIYVGQVDYAATPEELQEHFAGCGTVNRVTILCDQYKNPKGYAYIEFDAPEAVEAAVALNDSEFKSRQLKVSAKRTNVYGHGKGKGKGKGKGGKGFGKGKGKGKGKGGWGKGGYQPMYRPRGGRARYTPY